MRLPFAKQVASIGLARLRLGWISVREPRGSANKPTPKKKDEPRVSPRDALRSADMLRAINSSFIFLPLQKNKGTVPPTGHRRRYQWTLGGWEGGSLLETSSITAPPHPTPTAEELLASVRRAPLTLIHIKGRVMY